MQSTAWINGPYQHAGTHTQSSQAPAPVTRYVTSNQQSGKVNNPWQHMATNTVQPTQIATSHFGAYSNRQRANCQFSAVPHQAVSTINTQNGNPTLPGTLGFQQASHQNSAQNVSTHSPHQIMMLNTMHPQQGASTYRNQSVGLHGSISKKMQDGNASTPGHCRNILFQNSNRLATQLPPAAPSPPDGKTIYVATLPLATEPNRQHVFAPKHRNTAISQSFTTNSSQTGQKLHISSSSQNPQQYLTHYSRVDSTSTSSINSNSNSRSYETNLSSSKTNTVVEMQQSIAKIVDYLYDGSDGHPPVNTSLPHKKVNFIQDVSTTNQNMQPVTMTDSKILNSAAPLSLPPRYGQSSLQPVHQQVYVTPQESSASYVTATWDGSGNQAVKLSDKSSHSSPGRARAVAVVQPLSQESYQIANKEGTANKFGNTIESVMEKYLITPKNKLFGNLTPRPNRNPNRSRPNKSATDTHLSSSDSAGCCRDLSQKQCATEATTAMQVNQHVAPAAKQALTSKVPVSQSDCQDNSKTTLSSLPTTPWRIATLNMLIQDLEKAPMELNDSTSCNIMKKLVSMFWKDTDIRSILKMHPSLMINIREFCVEHVKPASVILSQVKGCFDEQLKGYHVLKDDEVYSELPYKSTWLNTDEGLDIDKEFPLCLQHRLNALQRDKHQVKTDSSMVKQTVNEDIKKLSSTDLDSSEDKQDSTVEATLTTPTKTKYDPYSLQIQIMSPESAKVIYRQTQIELPQSRDTDNQAESVTNSSVVGEPPKVTDDIVCGSEPEDKSFCPIEEVCCIARWKEIFCGSVPSTKCQCKDLQSIRDIPDETAEMVSVRQKDEIRLNSKFYAVTEEGSQVMDGESTVTLCSDTSDIPMDDDKPHSSSDKDLNHSLISINSSKSSILLISDDDDQAWKKSGSAKTKDNYITDTDSEVECVKDWFNCTASTPPCASVSSDKLVENLPSIETKVASQKLDPGLNYGQAQLPSTNVTETFQNYSSFETEDQGGVSAPDAQQTNSSLKLKRKRSSGCESEVANQKSNLDGNCRQAQGTSTIGTEWSLESEEQPRVSAPSSQQSIWSVDCIKRKRKRKHSRDRFYPVFKKSLVETDSRSKREQVLACDTDVEPPASSAQTVELVLFGSTTKDNCALLGSRKRHKTSPGATSDGVSKPPKVLTVNLSPVKRKSSKTLLNWDYSVEQLYKKWRIRLPKAQKTRKRNLASNVPTNAEESPASSKTPLKRTPILIRLKRGKQKRRRKKKTKNIVTLKQPADEQGNNAENVGHAVTSLQNNVLNFSVLPSFFDVEDGSNKKMKTSDPLPDTPGLFERKDKKRKRGSWCPDPEEKRFLLPPSTKTFQEFQKKYQKKEAAMH